MAAWQRQRAGGSIGCAGSRQGGRGATQMALAGALPICIALRASCFLRACTLWDCNCHWEGKAGRTAGRRARWQALTCHFAACYRPCEPNCVGLLDRTCLPAPGHPAPGLIRRLPSWRRANTSQTLTQSRWCAVSGCWDSLSSRGSAPTCCATGFPASWAAARPGWTRCTCPRRSS